jgi:arginine-tRNA-protein transferase
MELAYVYLGYWVEGSQRMQYKVRYRPMERLSRGGWERIGEAEHDRLIADAVKAPAAAKGDGTGKDGIAPIVG